MAVDGKSRACPHHAHITRQKTADEELSPVQCRGMCAFLDVQLNIHVPWLTAKVRRYTDEHIPGGPDLGQ
jgi:hypothetical protein